MTVIPTATTTTPDGRTLAYCEWGEPGGAPVFSLHGTPGSRFTRHPDEEVYRRAGVRAITYDRAGYGRSTRLPGRAVAHAAADVATIADALGIDRFAVMGGSGGGPHSLACAGLLAGRVTRCAAIVSPAPFGPEGLDRDAWLNGMVEGNIREFEWSLAGEDTLRPELEREVRELLSKIGTDQENPLGEGYELADSDMEVLRRWGIREMLDDSFLEGCGESVNGFVDDDLSFTRPWGFAVADIAVPVTVWYGREDTLVPTPHGEWLARTIPGAEVVTLKGGHFAIYERLDELLAWLTQVG